MMNRSNWSQRGVVSQAAKPVTKPLQDSADLVIIGNGIAGFTAAIEARRLEPQQRIMLISEQTQQTINTPALKQFAVGKLGVGQLLAYPVGTAEAERIEPVQGRVEEIHAQGNYICLSDRRAIGYRSLLISTGSTPTGLPANLPGRHFEDVLTLHRLPDYIKFRRRIRDIERAVVIGGGLHAIEMVMSLVELGIETCWLIRSETFLPRILDEAASDLVLERIWFTGIRTYTRTSIIEIVGKFGRVTGVITDQHQMIPCQLVVVCTGTTPDTMLARRCDLRLEHSKGIHVDNQLRTSLRHVYAAGDVAALYDPQAGQYEPRPQWYSAVQQGRLVASTITGHPISALQLFGVPWHATQVGRHSLLTVGHPLNAYPQVETLIESKRGYYRRMTVLDDRLLGYLSLGSHQPDGLAIKQLIDHGLSIRGHEKALLKGTFDIRSYLTRLPNQKESNKEAEPVL